MDPLTTHHTLNVSVYKHKIKKPFLPPHILLSRLLAQKHFLRNSHGCIYIELLHCKCGDLTPVAVKVSF